MARILKPDTREKPIGLINGKRPGSREEWLVANALWYNQWPFDFQLDYFGGRALVGGQVIDFMVHTPLHTVLFVDGLRWHGAASKRERDLMQRMSLMNKLAGRVMPQYIVITDKEIPTQEDADQQIARHFGRGPGVRR